MHFMRTISPPRAGSDTASSQYKINGRTVTHEAYDTRLATFAILVKARNFLVFQVWPPAARHEIYAHHASQDCQLKLNSGIPDQWWWLIYMRNREACKKAGC